MNMSDKLASQSEVASFSGAAVSGAVLLIGYTGLAAGLLIVLVATLLPESGAARIVSAAAT